MRRVVRTGAALLAVGGVGCGTPTARLTRAETERFFHDKFLVYGLVHREPAAPATWIARCRPVIREPTGANRAALERTLQWLRMYGNAEVRPEFHDAPASTVRTLVVNVADDIAECGRHVTITPAWRAIERRIRDATA